MTNFVKNYYFDLPIELKLHIERFLPRLHDDYLYRKMRFIRQKRIEKFLEPFGNYKEISSYYKIPQKYRTPLVKSWVNNRPSSSLYDHCHWYKFSSGWLCINSPYACWAICEKNVTKHEKLTNEGWTHIPQKLYNKDTESYYIFIPKYTKTIY